MSIDRTAFRILYANSRNGVPPVKIPTGTAFCCVRPVTPFTPLDIVYRYSNDLNMLRPSSVSHIRTAKTRIILFYLTQSIPLRIDHVYYTKIRCFEASGKLLCIPLRC
jgi:hypothetical protein